MRILVTGAAGFIGFHLAARLLRDGHTVVGVDNLNDYYDVALKRARLACLEHPAFEFRRLDLADREATRHLFAEPFDRVVHLAAQAGVRYSIDHPHEYVDSNLVGFVNVLEGCRYAAIRHLVYASSSSVYGDSTKQPFQASMPSDQPLSLYAATKRANELMARSYAHLYDLPVTGLRFFTVYGPWGRPDMAYFKFTRLILSGAPIEVYNQGRLARDFTYVDDIVEGLARLTDQAPERAGCPARVFNIGAGRPVRLMDFIEALEDALGVIADKQMLPMQPGDVVSTWADTRDLEAAIGFAPRIPLEDGVRRFVRWYRSYYGLSGVGSSTLAERGGAISGGGSFVGSTTAMMR